MDTKKITKITYIVNTILLIIVTAMMWFFHECKATFLVYFSIPTILVYVLGYYIIYHEKLYFYVMLVFGWITMYMCVALVCLGYNYGFQMYPLSLIPIIYYINYISYKLNLRRVSSALISTVIIISYLVCVVIVSVNGPIYKGNDSLAVVACCANSLYVFIFMIIYTKTIIKTIITSEEELKRMSFIDQLTGLYNRHYMVTQLEDAINSNIPSAVVIIDIDDFKKINDEYGHNAGDYVLRKLSKIMKENCKDIIISRWGGEEFLLLINNQENYFMQMEELRKTIYSSKFEFEGEPIRISVTMGISERMDAKRVNKWIQSADEKLYIGKNSGKNVVVA